MLRSDPCHVTIDIVGRTFAKLTFLHLGSDRTDTHGSSFSFKKVSSGKTEILFTVSAMMYS